MYYKNSIAIIFFIIFLSSCYIDSDENAKSEKANIILNIPISDEIMKAPDNNYSFIITLTPVFGSEVIREIVAGTINVLDNSTQTAVFPILLTDIPEGEYKYLTIEYRFYYPGGDSTLELQGYYETNFSINEGQNTTINVTMLAM